MYEFVMKMPHFSKLVLLFFVLLCSPISAAEQGPSILFVIGGEGTGGGPECGGKLGTNIDCKTEQLASIHNDQTFSRNHGWAEMATVLREDGFVLQEITEGPWDAMAPVRFSQLDLSVYDAIVMGSNNVAEYPKEDIDALEIYLREGGSVMFISDANFGPRNTSAMISDQQFLNRFGLLVNRDSGWYTSTREEDFTDAGKTHPILERVDEFEGEGVSPISVPDTLPDGVDIEVLAVAHDLKPPKGPKRSSTPRDGTLVAGTVGKGRFVGFFDRNTFFNKNGAGSNLHKHDNKQLALGIFRWMCRKGE